MDKNRKTLQAYDKNAEFYAEMFDGYSVRVGDIDRALAMNKSGCDRVLELGCGSGRDARYITKVVGQDNYLGIDGSDGLIKLAQKNVSGVTFQVGDMRGVSFGNEAFGVIFSFASVLHVNRAELADIIKKCSMWLKIGGILCISTKYGKYKEIEVENLGDIKYYYSYTPEDIRKIAGAGFETIYSVIGDSEYGPSLTLVLRKI